jgi:hypothetical protein
VVGWMSARTTRNWWQQGATKAMTVGGVLADLLPAQRCTAGQCVIVAKGGECGEHPEHGLMR